MTTPSMAPYNESIQEAVARETARRKRVLLAFLGLLLVPVAIGAYALSEAPTVKKIATEVTPIVAQSVSSDIATRVTNDVVARTEPLLRENVSREVAGTLEPRIASATSALQRDISDLQTTVRQTSTAVAATQRLATDVNQLKVQVDAALASRQQFTVYRQSMARDLEAVRALANISVQTANANKEAIGALAAQMSRIEGDLKEVTQRVTRLEDWRQSDLQNTVRPRPPGP